MRAGKSLDARLEAVAALILSGKENRNESTLVDIGSGHAKIPIFLLQNGAFSRVAVSDIAASPLERAKAAAKQCGMEEKIDFYLSDGFSRIDQYFDIASVCGMGGGTIVSVVESGKTRFGRLVAQPMTKAELLRRYLWENGFVIENELFPDCGGKTYLVLSASRPEEKEGENRLFTYADTFLGKIRPFAKPYFFYVNRVYKAAQKRFYGARRREDADLLRECEEILARFGDFL